MPAVLTLRFAFGLARSAATTRRRMRRCSPGRVGGSAMQLPSETPHCPGVVALSASATIASPATQRPRELRTPPAVPPPVPRRPRRPMERTRGHAWDGCDRRSSGVLRCFAPACRDLPRAQQPAVALARPSQPDRRPLGGRHPARSCVARSRRVAVSTLAPVAGTGRRRLRGDRALRHRDCHRDEMRREAPCCIPGAAGRNSKEGSWVQWLTRI